MSADPLADLLLRLGEQDRDALREVYDAAAGKLFAVSLRILKDRGEAEEALQEIFTRVWLRAGSYDPARGRAMPWLVAIARDHALDRLRARPVPPEAIAAAAEARIEAADEAPQAGEGTEEGVARIGPATALRPADDCINRLEPARAAALRSAYLDGLSHQELAARHGIPDETLRAWLHRSLAILRGCVGP